MRKGIVLAALMLVPMALGGCAAGAIGLTGLLTQTGAAAAGTVGVHELKKNHDERKAMAGKIVPPKDIVALLWKNQDSGDPRVGAALGTSAHSADVEAAYTAYMTAVNLKTSGKESWTSPNGDEGSIDASDIAGGCRLFTHRISLKGAASVARQFQSCEKQGWMPTAGTGKAIKYVAEK